MEDDQLICPVCTRCFDDGALLPRLIPVCGHTLCSQCIQQVLSKMSKDDLFICPADLTGMVLTDLDVDLFPKNYTFIRQIEKRGNSSSPTHRKRDSRVSGDSPLTSRRSIASPSRFSKNKTDSPTAIFQNSLHRLSRKGIEESLPVIDNGICKEHERKLELVCMDHKCRICVSCALFGQHKGHDYRTEEAVIQEIATKAESLIDLFQNIEEYQNKSLDQTIQDQISSKFRERLNELTQQDYINQLRIKEKKFIDNMNRKIIDLEDEFKQTNKVPSDLLDRVIRWKIEAQERLTTLGDRTDCGELDLDLLGTGGTSGGMNLSAVGSQILAELKAFNEIPQRALEGCIQGIYVRFTDDFQSSIESICELVTPTSTAAKWRNSARMSISSPTFPKPQENTRVSLGQSISEQLSSTPKFEKPQKRFSILNDDGLELDFDPKVLPEFDLSSDEDLKPSIVSKDVTANSAAAKETVVQSSRMSFGGLRGGWLLKNAASLDIESSHSPERSKPAVTHSQSTKHSALKSDSNFFRTPRATAGPKAKHVTFFNATPKASDRRTSTYSKNRTESTPSLSPVRSTLASKNKSPQKLTIDTGSEKSPNGSFLQEFSKSKGSATPTSSAKTAASSKKLIANLNPKFEPVIQGLRNETLETVDLTGAELGDQGVWYISDFIAANKWAKNIKLVKNKITDEGGIILAKALEENHTIQTVNLSQNLLTERTVEAFLNLVKVNPTLKYLYFNQNSMKIMNVKAKVKELQSLGVNTSI